MRNGADHAATATQPIVIVLMGVSGSGKTTTGTRLARMLDWPFRDADSFHPKANIDKMSRGLPLDDDDRRPWLAAIRAWIDGEVAAGRSAIVSCSALKRGYREILAREQAAVRIVHLVGSRHLIGGRLQRRRNHFMPASLLDSQFAALEPTGSDEPAIEVPVRLPPQRVAALICRRLGIPRPLRPA